MIAPLRAAIPRLAFGHRTESNVHVFSEVPAVHGVPDLTAIRFDWDAVSTRRSANVRPLSTDTEVRAVIALGDSLLSQSDLARAINVTPEYVRRGVVPLLVERGWFTIDSSGLVSRTPESRWIARRVVTVEAKLRDWHRAIGQARRQQLSSDAAFVALETRSARNIQDELSIIAAGGIGVIAVDPRTQRAKVLARPRYFSKKRSLAGRMLIAERCLEMWERGEVEGQIYPVFGWRNLT
ncbi:hypothetical protein [Salinibacterium sp. M195]|uniref:hypothetical protein n=1 Tax=Salinibacterium sp. M195 TaxID=2583374 RepID=UPI001C6308C3|nr:hypothetical protein [Salinibacterium sp. M195]QYH34740.1 hypothetical protein FFT87_01585 [Salinibacterium sp. M195]